MIATPWPHDGAPGDCDDGLRLQRIVSHVLVSARAGELPGLPWDLGLSGAERAHVVARWPAGAAAWDALRPGTVDAPPPLLMPLRGLLLAHRADASPALVVLTNALACACFGGYHLWQDLGATGRDEVSGLLRAGFPALYHGNVHNLRWKRHLFLQLGAQLGREDLRPPKCDGCDDYELCYGANDDAPGAKTWPLRHRTH